MAKKRLVNEDYIKEVAHLDESAPNEVKAIVSILGLKPKSKILDLCCGYGRHAVPLTQMGFKVTGIEISDSLYKKAVEYARTSGVKYRLIRCDMRNLSRSIKEKYDAIINIFTAFGFYTRDSDNQRILNAVAKALKPGGKFLIDLANRENILKRWQPRQWYSSGGTTVLEESMFDFFSSRLELTRTSISANNARQVSNFSIRLYSLHEMLAMIKKAGLTTVAVFGDFDMLQYSVDSRRMIILAQNS